MRMIRCLGDCIDQYGKAVGTKCLSSMLGPETGSIVLRRQYPCLQVLENYAVFPRLN